MIYLGEYNEAPSEKISVERFGEEVPNPFQMGETTRFLGVYQLPSHPIQLNAYVSTYLPIRLLINGQRRAPITDTPPRFLPSSPIPFIRLNSCRLRIKWFC